MKFNQEELIDSSINLNSKTLWISVPLLMCGIIGLFFAAGLFNFLILFASLVLFIFSLLFLFCKDYIAVNTKTDTLHICKNSFFLKSEVKYPIEDFKKIQILYSSYSSAGQSPESLYDIGSKHYEVFLFDKTGNRVFLKEYNEPGLASELQRKVHKKTGIPISEKMIHFHSHD